MPPSKRQIVESNSARRLLEHKERQAKRQARKAGQKVATPPRLPLAALGALSDTPAAEEARSEYIRKVKDGMSSNPSLPRYIHAPELGFLLQASGPSRHYMRWERDCLTLATAYYPHFLRYRKEASTRSFKQAKKHPRRPPGPSPLRQVQAIMYPTLRCEADQPTKRRLGQDDEADTEGAPTKKRCGENAGAGTPHTCSSHSTHVGLLTPPGSGDRKALAAISPNLQGPYHRLPTPKRTPLPASRPRTPGSPGDSRATNPLRPLLDGSAAEGFEDTFRRLTIELMHRYEDGEVTRYGAGESYRPFNRDRDRSPPPRRDRSPVRDRDRDHDRDRDRDRGRRSPPPSSDCYVPNRSPRRPRSRSADKYRGRERSRDGGERWRRERSRSRARSPIRRPSPRRSPRRSPPRRSPRRSPPRRSPGRYSPPRRDDRDRADRPRSPRRDFDSRDGRYAPYPPAAQPLTLRPHFDLGPRRRSRSPFDRDRGHRARSPLRRSPPPVQRSYRPRSRTPERRDDRYPNAIRRLSPPARDSNISSAITSRSASGPSSPRPSSVRGREDPSRGGSPYAHSPAPTQSANAIPVREGLKASAQDVLQTPAKSPPRGPAALRAPTGPSGGRNFTAPVGSPVAPPARHPATPTAPQREMPSPTIPPSGPRGYISARGGSFAPRGVGRGGWGQLPPRHMAPGSASPSMTPANPNAIPTGPRAAANASTTSPSLASRPFNPPTGPAAQQQGNIPRLSLPQQLLASMPALLPAGKLDLAATPLTTGIIKELEPHHRRLREEEERLRTELEAKQTRLRLQLRTWDKMERESKSFLEKAELSDRSLRKIAGEGLGGAAF